MWFASLGLKPSVEQLTYLLFLKMAEEQANAGRASLIPDEYSWTSLLKLDGDALQVHYRM